MTKPGAGAGLTHSAYTVLTTPGLGGTASEGGLAKPCGLLVYGATVIVANAGMRKSKPGLL